MKKNSTITTQIIAGKYKGKHIVLPSKDSTRSTKSIIKESLFNTLQFDIYNTEFIEVFGGSGSIGIEALSRGAKKAYFIEKDNKAFRTLKTNLDDIPLEDYSLHLGDSFELFAQVQNQITKAFFYFDPPFSIRDGYEDVYDKMIELISSIDKDKIIKVIVEHISSEKLPENIGQLKLIKTKKFGKSSLSYYNILGV